MAVDRVERLLTGVASALDSAGIEYAVIGGNAVAAWVATVDDAAVRSTKDVDLLVRRDDFSKVVSAVAPMDLVPVEVLGVVMLVDRTNPNPKTGVHFVFAGERVRPEYAHPAPQPSQARLLEPGLRVLEIGALLNMKLQAYRFIDRAHVQDLLSVGLIDQPIRDSLPADLRERLSRIEQESTR